MSRFNTSSGNYNGRVNNTSQGNIKQFVYSQNGVSWVYKKDNGSTVLTPEVKKYPVYIDNDLTVTGSIYNPSDERLKQNILSIDKEKTNELFTINPISFNYKNDPKNQKHFGVLAQDVEKIFPDLVQDNNISGYKTVNYQEFIPIMLAKMKQMQDEIDELKQKMN